MNWKTGFMMALSLPLWGQPAGALEAVANGQSLSTANSIAKLAGKLAALAAIVEALGDELKKVKTCNENRQFYDADTDKCLDMPDGTAPGTIAGFLGDCPPAWREYTAARGHFLVGHGDGGYAGNYPTLGSYVDSASKRGYSNVVLKTENLPTSGGSTLKTFYNYLVRKASGDKHANGRILACASGAGCKSAPTIKFSGGGANAPHENRPPFRVVKWCQKD